MFARLAECRQTPGPDSGIEALRAGLEVCHLRSHTLAVRQRPENQLSRAAFPVSQEDSIPSCLRAESQPWLGSPGWEVFCSGIGPWGPAPREDSHTPRERPANLHTALPSRLLCRRELSSLGRSALCSAPVGRTPWAPTCSLDLGPKLAFFFFFARGALTQDGPATACKGLPWLFASFCQS